MPRPHPDSTLFPYTTLFRSGHTGWAGHSAAAATHLHNSSTVFAPNPAVGRAPNRPGPWHSARMTQSTPRNPLPDWRGDGPARPPQPQRPSPGGGSDPGGGLSPGDGSDPGGGPSPGGGSGPGGGSDPGGGSG